MASNLPDSEPPTQEPPRLPAAAFGRIVALLEVLLCSDFPTQLAIGGSLAAFGYGPFDPAGRLRIGYVVALSVIDSALLVGLIVFFLRAHGERLRDLVVGPTPAAEIRLGIPLIALAFVLGVAVLFTVQRVAPSLHTVETNPLEALLASPRDIALFVVVIFVAGGFREEIQRAFLLRRFETWLGGREIGLVLTSVLFGAGHVAQGMDAAVATAVLGAFWGMVYLRRRSALAPIVSHAGFDLLQVAQALIPSR